MLYRIMGDALIWQLVRKNNSFLVKRGGGPRSGNASRSGAIQLSCEPGNIMGVNSFKYSGLAKTKAVGIEQTGTDLSMDMKAYKKANLPSKSGMMLVSSFFLHYEDGKKASSYTALYCLNLIIFLPLFVHAQLPRPH